MASSAMKAEELYMESSSKPLQFHSCWEICKGWVLFEDPPKKAPMPVFETASSVVDMDEDGSPTIQQKKVENPSSGEGSIPRKRARQMIIMPLNMKWRPHCDYWLSKMPLRPKK
ncbi:hypothetical protein D8674_043031 [Pyrus ussuriensis x Pyrus communis]|uniref:Uncharacterized protein n=1 Tax=Pyrus ussuriensis x Pyrus communis TaxID=2448454 RepID=A0A5N5GGY5_9ROSA|nr:hypothetical protein D8674_043031 [Pyrus ussuriensis x Pyrus communis]